VVLLEDLLAKFHTFGEGLEGHRDEMNPYNALEQKLDNHIVENRYKHQKLMQIIEEVDRDARLK
jgi:hypothetical protein